MKLQTSLRAWLLGLLFAFNASAAVLYVNVNGTGPMSPYNNWGMAATNIQDAVDVAGVGDTVLVTNGVYRVGGRVVAGAMSNRVAVTRAITVQSVNGPGATVIAGYQVPGTTNGDAAIRCVYLTNGAALSGFTLTNGATRASGTNDLTEQGGGGVWCAAACLVSNCVIKGNAAYYRGGGAYRGALVNCTVVSNTAFLGGGSYGSALTNCAVMFNTVTLSVGSTAGGGGYASVLSNCTVAFNSGSFGGGAADSTLVNCVVTDNTSASGGGADSSTLSGCTVRQNTATLSGGGAQGGQLVNCVVSANTSAFGGGLNNSAAINCKLTNNLAAMGSGLGGGTLGANLTNCVLAGNWAATNGGGSYSGTLVNCTLTGNGALSGGGAQFGTLYNCIVYFNNGGNSTSSAMSYCCTTPDPGGMLNFTTNPLLTNLPSGNFQLQPDSPCINSGSNGAIVNSTDLNGNPRVAGGTVDVGAYEFPNPTSIISYEWLQFYHLPTDGLADFYDTDGDLMNNWQEWRAGTDPLNWLSFLQMLTPARSVPGVTLRWQSGIGRVYFLQRCTNFVGQPVFTTIQSNIAGQAGQTSFTDSAATNRGGFGYRVGVQ